ncbi:hypothetical protein HI914_02961 [Erysiphe necator]|nr:hypothetical protein HI914_02961 [Erysiphe necator]
MSTAFYDIQYTINLTAHQRRVLALGITKLHNTAFRSFRDSVHVKFTCSVIYPHLHSTASYFVGGDELRSCNRIIVYIQSEIFRCSKGMVKNEEMIRQFAKSIEVMWDSYVCNGKSPEARLNAIIVIPGVVSSGRNYKWWKKSDSDLSCLSIDIDFGTLNTWNTPKYSNISSSSPSEYSSGIWKNQSLVNYGITPFSDHLVESGNEEPPKLKTRLNRKAKFHKLN